MNRILLLFPSQQPPNSFLFCTYSLSTFNFQPPDSPRVSIFAFQVSSNSFIYRFLRPNLFAISFIHRIYANHRGVPLKENMNATKPSIINEPATAATPRCQHRSLKGCCRQLATGPGGTLCFDHARAEQQAKMTSACSPRSCANAKTFTPPKPSTKPSALSTISSPRVASPRVAPPSLPYVDSLILRTLPAMAKQNGPTSSSLTCPAQIATETETLTTIRNRKPTYADVRT